MARLGLVVEARIRSLRLLLRRTLILTLAISLLVIVPAVVAAFVFGMGT